MCFCNEHCGICVFSSWGCFGEVLLAMVGWRGSLALAIRLTERGTGKCNFAYRPTLDLTFYIPFCRFTICRHMLQGSHDAVSGTVDVHSPNTSSIRRDSWRSEGVTSPLHRRRSTSGSFSRAFRTRHHCLATPRKPIPTCIRKSHHRAYRRTKRTCFSVLRSNP